MEDKEYDTVLQGLVRKREGLLAELSKVNTAIGAIEELAGKPLSTPADANSGVAAESTLTELPSKELGTIRPDEYFGLSQGQAAKKYLQKVGHAAHIEEIMKGITQGGIRVAGNSTRNLYIALVRNTTDFVLVGTNTFGLREFYPHLKRGKKESKPTTKGMRRTKPPKNTKTATKTRINKEEEKHTTKKVQPELDPQAVPKSGETRASE